MFPKQKQQKKPKKGLTKGKRIDSTTDGGKRPLKGKKMTNLSIPKPSLTPKKKPSRKSLVKKLDTIVSLVVRQQYKQCVVCGSSTNVQCGHVFSRSHYSTRWDFTNVFGQCAGCNLKHEHDPMPFYDWYQRTYGVKAFRELYDKWKEITHFKDYQLVEMIEQYKTFLNE